MKLKTVENVFTKYMTTQDFEDLVDEEVGKLTKKLLWHIQRHNYGKKLELDFLKAHPALLE